MSVKINRALCGLCLGCAVVCPESLFSLENDRLAIAEGCIACERCVDCCPVKAIILE
ncbi:MAG: ferredoxin [Candidatus Heimdallarchaeota archaeon]|nr:ferredoxin [Candidatus Heimdallarchaeota archaeon]